MTLFISGRRVKVQRKPLAILACLLEDQGQAIPYKRLHAVTGYVSDSRSSRHVLRQHISTLREILRAHNAGCAIGIIQGIGYALCEIAEVTPPSEPPAEGETPPANSEAH
jgi:DNA-binding response OmpR family regulator